MFYNKTLPAPLKKDYDYMSIGRIAVTVFTTAVKRDLTVEAHKRTDALPPFGFNHNDLAAAFFDDLQTMITSSFASQHMLVADSLHWAFEHSYVDETGSVKIANWSYISEVYGAFKRIGKDKDKELDLAACEQILQWFKENYVVIISTPTAVTDGALVELDPTFVGVNAPCYSKFA